MLGVIAWLTVGDGQASLACIVLFLILGVSSWKYGPLGVKGFEESERRED
jgi:hypothetical protein